MRVLGAVYGRIPAPIRPIARTAFVAGSMRFEGLRTGRRVERGQRVEFLDFEIAHLEPYNFLGPGKHEVLVEAHATVVSPGTERAVLCGLPGGRRPFPYSPGYSAAGVAKVVGSAVRGIAPGDLVAGRMPHASHGIMSAVSVFRVPTPVTARSAAFIELGIICLQGIRKARIHPGCRVAVIGMGLIGQMAARLARVAGADPLVVVANSRRRFGPVAAYADESHALADDPTALGRIGADVVIEAVGSARGIVQALDAARPGGVVILLGSSRDLGRNVDWWGAAQRRQVTVVGAHISNVPATDASPGRWTYAQEGRLFLELLAAGRLVVDDLVTWDATPDQCNAVYEVVAEGGRDHVGILFDWARRDVSAKAG
jgi:threonine dehydrogenase-like Zn-dependent dehydrogenase